MASIFHHATNLQDAITRAVAEHGPDNSFSFAELHANYGGPMPLVAGRAWRKISDEWKATHGLSIDEKTKRVCHSSGSPTALIPSETLAESLGTVEGV